MLSRLRTWARAVKLDLVALSMAARDPRVPWYAKAVAALVAAYVLSPIDLIPDFIPVVGYLDDLILVPLGILLAAWLVPEPLMREFRARAADLQRPASLFGIGLVLGAWIVAGAGLTWWALRRGTL